MTNILMRLCLSIFIIFFVNFCSIDLNNNNNKEKKQEQLLLLGLFVISSSNYLIGMSDAYFNHTATLLNDGNVLVRGNSSAELYDANTNSFSQITNELSYRQSHTATLLESGKVLITGGMSTDGAIYDTAEIYDPSTNAFTNTGNMTSARSNHTATLMSNGKVLLIGGFNFYYNHLSSAEIYNPNTGIFTSTGSMNYTRVGHTATLRTSGKLVIYGGFDYDLIPQKNIEFYDSSTESFSLSSQYMTFERGYHRATLMQSDDILITGGLVGNTYQASTDFTEVPNTYSKVKGRMNSPRTGHTATLLQNGKVLITGGTNYVLFVGKAEPTMSSMELYDSDKEIFENAGSMLQARTVHTATLLNNGKVLITGGIDSSNDALSTAEIYSP